MLIAPYWLAGAEPPPGAFRVSGRAHGKHLFRLLAEGRPVALVAETGRRLDQVKERMPVYRFETHESPVS